MRRALLAMSAGAASPWTPASLSGLKLWLDAADSATITESSGAVSAWADKSATGMDFAQADAGLMPTTGSTTQNGLNVLAFDSDILTRAVANSEEWKFLHDGTAHLIGVVFSKTGATNQGVFSTVDDGGAGDGPGAWLYSPSTSLSHAVKVNTTNVVSNVGTTLVASGVPLVVTVLADPDNATASARSSLFKDAGTAVANNTATGTVNGGRNTARDFIIGSLFPASSATYRLAGWIAEIVVASGTDATEDNRALLRNYLNTKWGIY